MSQMGGAQKGDRTFVSILSNAEMASRKDVVLTNK